MTSSMASIQLNTAQDDDTPHDPIIEEALRRVLAGKSGGAR
ncbi:hypothetical protein ACGRHY_27260 [Streptomyces sp. HK10]